MLFLCLEAGMSPAAAASLGVELDQGQGKILTSHILKKREEK